MKSATIFLLVMMALVEMEADAGYCGVKMVNGKLEKYGDCDNTQQSQVLKDLDGKLEKKEKAKSLQQRQMETTAPPVQADNTTAGRTLTPTPNPQSTTTDGWTVFQRRQDGSVNFDRTWDEYVNGFGNEDGEFWLGLEKLHQLTSSGKYKLRIDLRDWERNSVFAQYSEFSVGSQSDNYRLAVSGYSGTAGDSLINPGASNTIHNKMAFSTKNFDNDLSSNNCAELLKGGWWFNSCYSSNLNGIYHSGGKYTGSYADGIVWSPWKNDWWYSMKFVEMKLRPAL